MRMFNQGIPLLTSGERAGSPKVLLSLLLNLDVARKHARFFVLVISCFFVLLVPLFSFYRETLISSVCSKYSKWFVESKAELVLSIHNVALDHELMFHQLCWHLSLRNHSRHLRARHSRTTPSTPCNTSSNTLVWEAFFTINPLPRP